jgi:dipeptidyl-peptidase-4
MRKLFFLFLLAGSAALAQSKKSITLEDIWLNGTFSSKYVSGFNFMNDGRYFTEIENGDLLKKEVASGKTIAMLVNGSDLVYDGNKITLQDYTFSEDESRILIRTESESIFRRSSKAFCYVFNLKDKKLVKISNDKILHPAFNPQGSMVAFMKEDNNLYLYDIAQGTQTQITSDGKKNSIINGNCDWVYEEEFEFSRAFLWNSTGTALNYYKFDETNVLEYSMPVYGKLYPENNTFKYPKAGEDNSFVSIWSYSVEKKESKRLFSTKDHQEYIPRVKNTNDPNVLCIYSMNRHQDDLRFYFTNINTGEAVLRYQETNSAWVEVNDNIAFLKDGKSFVYTSEKDGWNHIYMRSIETGKEQCLTVGNYDVEEIKGVDEKTKLIYYTSAEQSPMDRQLYSISFDGKKKKQLTTGKGTHYVDFNTDFTFFTDNYSTINTPPVIQLCEASGKTVKVLEDNSKLNAVLSGYSLSNAQFTKINDLNAWMIRPPDFDSTKKYPVLMYVYGGPGSQTVKDAWMGANFAWFQMLAEKGYIIISVDNTGTGFRGAAFKRSTYKQMGNLESRDQIAAAETIAGWSFVDKSRIGIWGWSYGGFMSSSCIMKGANVFKTAIAVAPVTNWRYYDNIYTERYMRTPAENASGYDDNSPVNMASMLKGNYLIIHGTGDDNVHFQNSVMMVDALIKLGKTFDSEFYPNKSHSISGGKTRYQLYTKMTNFLLEKL